MMLALTFALILASAGTGGSTPRPSALDCHLANSHVEEAIAKQAASLNANEYCQFRHYEALSDLDGDHQNDLIVLFNVEPRGGNDHLGFMAIFLSSRPADAAFLLVPTGGRGERDAGAITVRGTRITLDTQEYLPKDPMCCPSGEGTLTYEVKGAVIQQVPQGTKKRKSGA
jgi:hypothetical protein